MNKLTELTAENECGPIKSLSALYAVQTVPPKWTNDIIELRERSATAIPNESLQCHRLNGKDLVPNRIDRDLIPKTIVCHDMKTGYLDDRFVGSPPDYAGNGYTFYLWQQIDMFIYFSHNFITIPPLHWINLAHKNGVQVLGTIITECEKGEAICIEFLKDQAAMTKFVDALVAVSVIYKLDGWLVNIENDINDPQMLVAFVKYLTERMHVTRENSVVIWYDSVTSTGELHWQNELNPHNMCYFDVCDGIFLNYTWTSANLMRSAKVAQHRSLDVYVGIDVFGRNTPYKQGFDCYRGVKRARDFNFSVAIFAPGWTNETSDAEPADTFFTRFLENDRAFWFILWPHLYTHPVNQLFDTNFYVGADSTKYRLFDQQLQLTHVTCGPTAFTSIPEMQNRCDCLQLHQVNNMQQVNCLIKYTVGSDTLHHLLATSIHLKGTYLLYTYTTANGNDCMDLVLMVCKNGRMQKITCRSDDAAEQLPPYHIRCLTENEVNNLTDEVKLDLTAPDYNLRCYFLNFPNVNRLLHIYATFPNTDHIILNGLGLKQLY